MTNVWMLRFGLFMELIGALLLALDMFAPKIRKQLKNIAASVIDSILHLTEQAFLLSIRYAFVIYLPLIVFSGLEYNTENPRASEPPQFTQTTPHPVYSAAPKSITEPISWYSRTVNNLSDTVLTEYIFNSQLRDLLWPIMDPLCISFGPFFCLAFYAVFLAILIELISYAFLTLRYYVLILIYHAKYYSKTESQSLSTVDIFPKSSSDPLSMYWFITHAAITPLFFTSALLIVGIGLPLIVVSIVLSVLTLSVISPLIAGNTIEKRGIVSSGLRFSGFLYLFLGFLSQIVATFL